MWGIPQVPSQPQPVPPGQPWARMIALVDMNAFFASLEQLDHPHWRGRPVAVTNGLRGSCCITCSYEARAYGVKTGMTLREGRKLCPGLIQAPSRPERYAEVSERIMASLQVVTPDIEIFSVDEAFLDLTEVQRYHRYDPTYMGRLIKGAVYRASGLLCSVGVSGDKTTAKWAAKQQKPNGLTVVEPWTAATRLAPVPMTDLCGIKRGIGGYLAERGVITCGDMQKLPISELGRRYGNPGRRIWLMAQGLDPEPVRQTVKDPKSMGHGKVIPPDTRERQVLQTYYMHMSHKLARRLRRHSMEAQQFSIGAMTAQGWLGQTYARAHPTADGAEIYEMCEDFLERVWEGSGIFQVHVRANDPKPAQIQGDFFRPVNPKRQKLLAALDRINERYGEFTVCPAPLIHRSEMPNVIAPSWKPFGHRDTIRGG